MPITSYAWGPKAGMEDPALKKTLPGAKWKKLKVASLTAAKFKSTTSQKDSPSSQHSKMMSSFA